MSTKYILVGGYPHKAKDGGKAFVEALVADFQQPVKILVHYKSDYNSPNIDWDIAYNELSDYKETTSILGLAEGEFKIITQ